MARKLFTIIVLFFISVCCMSCSFYVIQKKDDIKPDMDLEEMPIPLKIQHEIAIHEAGHAIAIALLLGPDSVNEIAVKTVQEPDEWRGHCVHEPKVRRYDAETLRDLVVISLMGRAVDDIINGHPVAGAGADLENARARLYRLHYKYGLGETLVSYPDDYITEDMLGIIKADLHDCYELAEEIVRANLVTINMLAYKLMRINESGDARTMKGVELRRFLKKRKLVDPRKTE